MDLRKVADLVPGLNDVTSQDSTLKMRTNRRTENRMKMGVEPFYESVF
jgi:hypothetical protein